MSQMSREALNRFLRRILKSPGRASGGKKRITLVRLYPSIKDMNESLQHGMEEERTNKEEINCNHFFGKA